MADENYDAGDVEGDDFMEEDQLEDVDLEQEQAGEDEEGERVQMVDASEKTASTTRVTTPVMVETEGKTDSLGIARKELKDQEHEELGFKIELACEIYAALPAAHQRRLLILSHDIFELGPSPDRFTKWKILRWSANRWNPGWPGANLQLSANGLDMSMGYYRAIHGVEFLPTQLEGPQFCYFEMKHIKGLFTFGFEDGNGLATNRFLLCSSGVYQPGVSSQSLPNVHIPPDEIATVGCGLMKHLGQRKVFFTKNGELLAKPIQLPATAPNELFPYIYSTFGSQWEDTNFGLRPFQFKYKGNEEALSKEYIFVDPNGNAI